eukprot:Opistho-2@62480
MKKFDSETASLAFSLLLPSEESLDFVAASRQQYAVWLDALRVLSKQGDPDNQLTVQDLELLSSIDMRIRLLEAENVHIPDKAPPVPPPPSDFGFAFPSLV